MHKKWADTYAKRVRQEDDLYASTAYIGAYHLMQEALTKFHAKREFMERAYANLIAMDANNFVTYSALIKLALGVNCVKMMAPANIQTEDNMNRLRQTQAWHPSH